MDVAMESQPHDHNEDLSAAEEIMRAHQERLALHLGAVAAAQEAIVQFEDLLTIHVRGCRLLGATWAQIGEAAGMTGQGAHRRWKHVETPSDTE